MRAGLRNNGNGARVYAFLYDTRAGATAIASAAVAVMTVGAAALVIDHIWLFDQRDVLKTAADAAAVAATIEMKRQLAADPHISDGALETALQPVAERYVEVNFAHLPAARLERAKETLVVEVDPDRGRGTVDVSAAADLGGTLFASRLPLFGGFTDPEAIHVDAKVECTTNVVEVVLAFDVTHSMNASFGGARRIDVAIDAARALLDVLWSGCADTRIAVGIVPWDRSVRLPAPQAWERNGWVDVSGYRSVPAGGANAWAGCLEDRSHAINAPQGAAGLSLELPGHAAFPAYLYPDTANLDPGIVDDAYQRLAAALPDAVADLGEDALRQRLRAIGDNHWGEPLRGAPGETGGPNARCTKVAMLPLTGDRGTIARTLDALDTLGNDELWQGGTMAHLGVTWSRRMLAPSWRAVWGGETHPVDSDEPGAVKALVLLTDGQNWAGDRPESLPGRFFARWQGGTLDFVDAGECRQAGGACERLGKHHTPLPPDYASIYSALGRLGTTVRREDGGQRMSFSHTVRDRNEAAWVLNKLLADSCEAAQSEGVSVYTVSMVVDTDWNQRLIACSGTAQTRTDDERAAFNFMGDDPESIGAAFRQIGQSLISVRRVL